MRIARRAERIEPFYVMETVAIGAAQRSGGSSSGIAPQQVKPAISSKRKTIYWRSNQAD